MDSMEVNKAAAAVLTAGIAFAISGLIGETLVHPGKLVKPAITIPGETAAPTGGAPAEQPIALLLASASAEKGQAAFNAVGCVACHTVAEGGKPGIGPNLYGVVGEPVGKGAGGYSFSAALSGKGGEWTFDKLNEWLTKPAAFAPGTKMTFAGVADAKKRADIIMYLRSLSKSPVALPAVPATAAAAPAAGAAGGGSIKERLAAADPKAGQAAFMQLGCIACHTFAEGGKAGIGPNLWGVVGEPIGKGAGGYQFSSALSGKGGEWTYELLDTWLTKPAAFAPGTKMTFAGVADPKKRADVISYLRTLSAKPVPLP